MKKTFYSLLFSLFNLFGMALYAQKQVTPTPTNPRVSTKSFNQKDTVTSQFKPVTISDSSKVNSNKPIQGGLLSVSGLLGFPQNDFGAYTNNTVGYGFDISVLANVLSKRSRAQWDQRWVNVYVGGNFQFMRQDGTSDSYTVDNINNTSVITSKVRNNMSGIGLLSRVEFFPGPLKLFAEVGLGTRLFASNHNVEIENTPKIYTNPNDVVTTNKNYHLRSELIGNFSYGGGLRMSQNKIGIEFKILSVQGSTAKYVDVKSIQFNRNDNSVTYETKQSQTDMIIFQVGISGRF